jgi:universal stress protein A
MLPVRTILHPTDFSDRSGNALALAQALARDYGARLVILHVAHTVPVFAGEGMVPVSPEEIRAEAEEQLRALRVADDQRVERRLEMGDAVTEILRVARELPADLIVMGTHGRTGLGRLLMGSVAEQVVRRASCPVLTVSHPFMAAG